jgi:hypothetical protein
VKLRDPSQWKIAGQPLHRLDIPDKVRGKPVFAVDVALPRMLHAAIAQCPVFGGRVARVEDGDALAMRGIKKVVREPDFVAVVADNWWRANQALKKVKIEWDARGTAKPTTNRSKRCCVRAWPIPICRRRARSATRKQHFLPLRKWSKPNTGLPISIMRRWNRRRARHG